MYAIAYWNWAFSARSLLFWMAGWFASWVVIGELDNKANSVQLQLPTGIELGNTEEQIRHNCEVCDSFYKYKKDHNDHMMQKHRNWIITIKYIQVQTYIPL